MADIKGKDEKPMNLKSKRSGKSKVPKKTPGLTCIIHYSRYKGESKIRPLSLDSFKKIQSTAEVRQSQIKDTDRLDDICSQIPSQHCPRIHGIHRWCYSNFTNVSRLQKRRLSSHDAQNDAEPCSSKRRKSSEAPSTSILFPPNECLLCGKARTKKHGKEEGLVKCLTSTAEQSIKTAAEEKQREDILLKVRDVDLVAREAHYHPSCRKNFTRKDVADRYSRKGDVKSIAEQNAHKAAFDHLAQHIKQSIIEGYNVERMSMLREMYLQYLLQHYSEFYNANYKTCKLKSKLITHFGSQIQFWQPNYRSDLVYSSGVPKGQAVESAFEMASSESKRLEEAALILRRTVQVEHKECSEMPWPPSSKFLMSDVIKLPSKLSSFIGHLTSWRPEESSPRKRRLLSSIAQDICYAITDGRWAMPKHLLLGMTLRHLTGSAEIVTLINRFGHCASYSRLLELETALCRQSIDKDRILPPAVHPEANIVTHLCWDNIDLQEETPSGSGTTHTAHGIVIQEISGMGVAAGMTSDDLTSQPRTKERSISFIPQDMEPSFLKGKAEPKLIISTTQSSNTQAQEKAEASDILWIACRAIPHQGLTPDPQNVPPWAGWVSMTGSYPDNDTRQTRQSTVDYLPPVFAPVTDNATVEHILKRSQEVTQEVGQQYTIVTFDLAVAKKAFAYLWEKPQVFRNVIVRLGGFHLTCAFMCALGKSLRGSGFEEILVESGICASGSIERVLTGKHYNRALRVHKLMVEAFERLVLEALTNSDGAIDDRAKEMLIRLAADPSEANVSEALTDEHCIALLSRVQDFKRRIRQGELGKTAQFWMMYIDRVWLILQFQRATKENNLDLHLTSLQRMCTLFFSYDHPNYARYTTVYLLSLLNLPESHPGAEELLRSNGFSVSRSDVPSCRNAVDLTIEQTINRHAKSQGGIIGFSRNYSAYYRWCMTRHARASYQQATLEMADMEPQEFTAHKDVKSSRIIKSEEDTCKVVKAISDFINPFEVENKDILYCLSSGVPAPDEIANDLLRADTIGKEAYDTFVSQRLLDDCEGFHNPIKKCKLKTFADLAKSRKVTGKCKKTKQVTAERNVFGQLVLLAMNHDISMQKVLCFPLGPIPWALATADGVPVKIAQKSNLMHALESNTSITERPTGETSCIIDGMAALQAQMALPNTFGELAQSLFGQLPKVQRVDFVTDSYFPLSIKGVERARRGTPKPHMVSGPLTKVPRDWKAFLSSDTNKQRLTNFLLDEWQKDKYASQFYGRQIFFVCEQKCFLLQSSNGRDIETEEVEALSSTQEEADTKIILHCLHIASHTQESSTIIVRCSDTDVFILLLHFMQNVKQSVLFITGKANKRRLLDIHRIIDEAGRTLCHALPAIHSFSGCDTTSAFVRKGKSTHMKVINKHEEYLDAFLTFGRSSEIDDHTYDILESYVCRLYSRQTVLTDINSLRHNKFLQRFDVQTGQLLSSLDGVDISLLPPCRDALRMHVKRANYQALIWYTADQATPDIPPPQGQGWDIVDGNLEIKWTEGDLMPQELADILVDEPEDEDIENNEDGNEELYNLADVVFDIEEAEDLD